MSKLEYFAEQLKAKPESAFAQRLLKSIENRPKKLYTEITKGSQEKIIFQSDEAKYLKQGWTVTSLSKVSPSLVIKKWRNAIDVMEKL